MTTTTRSLSVLAASMTWLLVGCTGNLGGDGELGGIAAEETPGGGGPSDPAPDVMGQMVVEAGSGGSIWVLAHYSNGNTHPGENAIDVGSPGGSAVWHQLGDIPDGVAGGWIFVDQGKEAGYCSQWNPGDDWYNGEKLRVYTYFYGADGGYLGFHRGAYQHVLPDGVADTWWTWNNDDGTSKLWEAPQLTLGNEDAGGLYLGTLFEGGDVYITNGEGGALCHSGDHLHQESMGWRGALSLDDSVTQRVTDLHGFQMAGGTPAPGEPPADPPADDPPADDPPADDPPADDPPADDPPGTCACATGIDNFCLLAPGTGGCPMTLPGGYCDPNGDGDYSDADWVTGWYDYAAHCG